MSYTVCRQIQTELETITPLSWPLSKACGHRFQEWTDRTHAFVPRLPSSQRACGDCSYTESSGCKLKVTDADIHPHLQLLWWSSQLWTSRCKASLQQDLQVLQQHHNSHKETKGSPNLSVQARPASVWAATHHILSSSISKPFLHYCSCS